MILWTNLSLSKIKFLRIGNNLVNSLAAPWLYLAGRPGRHWVPGNSAGKYGGRQTLTTARIESQSIEQNGTSTVACRGLVQSEANLQIQMPSPSRSPQPLKVSFNNTFFGLPSKDMGGHRAVTTSSVRHCGNTLSKPNEGPYSWLILLRGLSNVPVWRINALKLDLSHFCLVTSSIQSTPLLWAPSRHWHEPDVR